MGAEMHSPPITIGRVLRGLVFGTLLAWLLTSPALGGGLAALCLSTTIPEVAYRCQYNDPDWSNSNSYGPANCFIGATPEQADAVHWQVDGPGPGTGWPGLGFDSSETRSSFRTRRLVPIRRESRAGRSTEEMHGGAKIAASACGHGSVRMRTPRTRDESATH